MTIDADITTSGVSTFLTPVLYDDDGTQKTVITRALLNSRNREGERTSTPFAAGTTWHAHLEFQPVDWVLSAGDKLGLAMMSMNRDEALYPDDVESTNTLLLGPTARLVVPASANATALGDPAHVVAVAPPHVATPRTHRADRSAPGVASRRLATTGTVAWPGAALLLAALGVLVVRRRARTRP